VIRRLALVAALLSTSAVGLIAPAAQAADADVAWLKQEVRPSTRELGLGVALASNASAVYDLVQRATSVELVKRRTSNGAEIWRRTIVTAPNASGLAVETGSDGDVFVLSAEPTRNAYTLYVTRWSPTGALEWSTPVVSDVSSPSHGELTIGPSVFWAARTGGSPDTDLRIGSVAQNGTWTWGRRYNSPWNERVFDLLWTPSTGLMMAGDTEAAQAGGKGNGDAFVWYVRTSDGTVVDVNSFSGEGFIAGQSLAVGPDGTVYFALIEKTGTQTVEVWKVHRDSSLDTRVMTFTADELMQSVRGMFVDRSGFVFVGTARGKVDGASTSFGNDDLYVMRTNRKGTRRTTVMLGTPSTEIAWRAVRDGNRLYFGGFTAGRLLKGTGRPAATMYDPFVVSLSIPRLPR
jgi:hypothetical protein